MKNQAFVFSIIVPVYNTEKFLAKCIDSILGQKYEDWELLLIDDGSTDSSGSICDNYAKNDNRIKVLHQQNAGPGAARNRGLDNACGEFVVFVDADDWVDSTFLSDYIESMQNSDIVYQGHRKEYNDGKSIKVSDLELNSSDIAVAIRTLWEHDYFGYTCLKCFRRSIIEDNNIRFDTDVYFREDTIFTAQYFKYVKNVKVLPVANYHYRYLDSSLQHTRFNVKEMLTVDDRIYEAFSKYFENESFRIFTEQWYLVNLHNGIKKSFTRENRCSFTDNERKILIEKCISHRHKVSFYDYSYSKNPLLNHILKLLWSTNNTSFILNGFRWLMR